MKISISYDSERISVCSPDSDNGTLLKNITAWLSAERGFAKYKDKAWNKEYKLIAKSRTQLSKGSFRCHAEYHPSGFNLEFGHILNKYPSPSLKFWRTDDKRRVEDSYVNNKRIELEIKKLGEFLCDLFPDAKVSIIGRSDISPIEVIRQEDIDNAHIHGSVTGEGLEYIRKHMEKDNYDRNSNSFDRDKKRIVCGELKSFYNYDGNLMQGEAWHNINNMWWILANGKRYNISSHGLFDYNNDPLKDCHTPRRKRALLQKREDQAANSGDYEKAIIFRELIKGMG